MTSSSVLRRGLLKENVKMEGADLPFTLADTYSF